MTHTDDHAKRLAAEKAVEWVKDDMAIGLGTGSTARFAVEALGRKVRQGLRIRAIATSFATEALARQYAIPLTTFDEVEQLDLTIDGADEISPELHLIKGGGGALLREKLVAAASEKLIIVADASKRVAVLGTFPLPVEVVPFGWETSFKRLKELGVVPTLRREHGAVYLTDNGHYIADLACGPIREPWELHQRLKALVGVVETGLFVGMTTIAIISDGHDVEVLSRSRA